MVDTIPQQTQIGPFDAQRAARKRSRTHRIEARNELARVKSEAEMHKLARDEGYIAWVYEKMKACPDLRAQTTWGKLVAEIMRLGKREANSGQTTVNQQVNIVLPSGDEARAILERLEGIGRSRMGNEQSQVLDVDSEEEANNS